MKYFYLKTLAFMILFFQGHISFGQAPYCSLSGLDTSWPISLVEIANINNSSSANTSGTSIYEDFTSQVINVQKGNTYLVRVKGNTSSKVLNYVYIYIDWNNDGDFKDANEVKLLGTLSNSSGTDNVEILDEITVPSQAIIGTNLRLRILKYWDVYYSSPSPNDGCRTSSYGRYGQYEDYSINVSALTPCSGTPQGGTITLDHTFGEPNSDYTVSASGYESATDLRFQWQSNTNGNGWLNQGYVSLNYSKYFAKATENIGDMIEWRLKVTCINGGAVAYSDINKFYVFKTYCKPTYTNNNELDFVEYLEYVKTKGAMGDINYVNLVNNKGGKHDDRRDIFLQAYPGQEFVIDTKYKNRHHTVGIWADWNDDGEFKAADGELIDVKYTYKATQSFKIAIPSNLSKGFYTLRVRSAFNMQEDEGDSFACSLKLDGSSVDFNIEVVDMPACLTPKALKLNNISNTTANISWTKGNTETQWNIVWGNPGFTPGDPNQIGTATVSGSPAYQVTGLTLHTDYEVYVRADCGGSKKSTWLGPLSIKYSPCPTGNILYVKSGAVGNNTGLNWTNAFSDLQSALAQSYQCSNVNEVWVAKGTYKPTQNNDKTDSFVMKNNLAIYGGFAGTETNRNTRNIQSNETILSGDLNGNDQANFINYTDNSHHVVFNFNNKLDQTAILDGFTIKGGSTELFEFPYDNGAGVYNFYSSPRFDNIIIKENLSAESAGGMYNIYQSSPVLNYVSFLGNKSTTYGGGIFNTNISSPTITNSIFSGNETYSYGGGVANNYYSSPTFINCVFTGNKSDVIGGGILNVNNCATTLINCTISGNHATLEGGGLFEGDNYPVSRLYNNIILGNSSGVFGNLGIRKSNNLIQTGSTWSVGAFDGAVLPNTTAAKIFIFSLPNTNAPTQSGNYRLKNDSWAINKGNKMFNPGASDLDKNPRISGVQIDLGAYENLGTGCPVLTNAPNNVNIINSICQPGCTLGGGQISPPSGSLSGASIQYSVSNGAWSSTLPVYNQNTAINIRTRWVCVNDANTVSPPSASVTTIPGICFQDDLNIITNINNKQESYESIKTISANNKIEGASVIDYKAGNSITLTPGFMVIPGSIFRANIQNPCAN